MRNNLLKYLLILFIVLMLPYIYLIEKLASLNNRLMDWYDEVLNDK